MNQIKLCKAIAKDLGGTEPSYVLEIMDSMARVIKASLLNKETVHISKFGTFSLKIMKGRNYNNKLAKGKNSKMVKSENPIFVPDRYIPKFKFSIKMVQDIREMPLGNRELPRHRKLNKQKTT